MSFLCFYYQYSDNRIFTISQLIIDVAVTSIGFTWTLDLTFGQTLHCIAYIVIVDFILFGIAATTFTWLISNRYLRQNPNEADVEWGYSWDVHLNAFFPPLVLLHFVQLVFFNSKNTQREENYQKRDLFTLLLIHYVFLIGVINSESFFSRLFGNTIWLIAFIYYIYITFLGYNCT